MGHPRLGVTHGGRGIPVNGTKISLTFDQGMAHAPGLGHVDQGRVNNGLAVRVVVTGGVPTNFGAFPVLPPRIEAEVIHGHQDPALGRFQSIPGIREGT
jgi:hypothetical protein